MKRKINNVNTKSKNIDTNVSSENNVKLIFLGEYFNIHTFQMHPITTNFILREATYLKQWADHEDSLRITDFIDKQGYEPAVFYRWLDEHPELNAANQYALRRIGARRENGAMSRKFDGATVHRTLGYYDHVWKEETRLMNEARQAVAEKGESKVVVIERFPSQSGRQDVEVVSVSSLTPEEVAGQIHRQTGDQRIVKVNTKNLGDAYEE